MGVMVRLWSLRLAVGTLALATVTTLLAWASPFPLISDGRGGYSNSLNLSAMIIALCSSLLTCFFALLAKTWRWQLFLAGIVSVVFSYFAMLANGS